MSRIKQAFETLEGQGKKALIPYITAGDPQKEATVPMMHALVDAGADIIELGIQRVSFSCRCRTAAGSAQCYK